MRSTIIPFSLFSGNGFHKIDKYAVFFYDLNTHSVFHRGDGSPCSSSDNPFERRDTVVRHENLNIDRIISRTAPAGPYKKTTFGEITRYACKAFIINHEFCCKPLNESRMSSFVHLLCAFQIDLSVPFAICMPVMAMLEIAYKIRLFRQDGCQPFFILIKSVSIWEYAKIKGKKKGTAECNQQNKCQNKFPLCFRRFIKGQNINERANLPDFKALCPGEETVWIRRIWGDRPSYLMRGTEIEPMVALPVLAVV